MTMSSLKDAKTFWNFLNGVICVYKPPRYPWKGVSNMLRSRLSREINLMVPTSGIPYKLNPLVKGPMIIKKTIPIYGTLTDHFASGVTVVGLRRGWSMVCDHHRSSPIKVYQVKGRLGIATDTFDTEGNVCERANHWHVTRDKMDRMVAAIQSRYQRSMYDACGVPLQSQAAFELAAGGLVRPADKELPVFYGIKVLEFENPDFILEVSCVNENGLYMKRLIHDLGFRLRTVATCSGIRCIRYGPFTVEHALPKHNWKLPLILDNMEDCTKMLITDMTSDRLESPHLIASPETSWEETERKLVKHGVLKKHQLLNSGESTVESAELAANMENLPKESRLT